VNSLPAYKPQASPLIRLGFVFLRRLEPRIESAMDRTEQNRNHVRYRSSAALAAVAAFAMLCWRSRPSQPTGPEAGMTLGDRTVTGRWKKQRPQRGGRAEAVWGVCRGAERHECDVVRNPPPPLTSA